MSEPEPTSATAAAVSPQGRWNLRRAVEGFVLGFLSAIGAMLITMYAIRFVDGALFPVVAGLVGGALAQGRARSTVWAAAGLVVVAILVAGTTPLVPALMRSLLESEPPRPAPAVVVLGSDSAAGVDITSEGEDRVLHAFELLHAGYAPRLVLSRGSGRYPSWAPAVQRQMRALGLDYPMEVTAPVETTHDEALEVARLVRQHGWTSVLLVTHTWHMRRAAATFRKAGITVVCSACVERRYNARHVQGFIPRCEAFRDWLHEFLGLRVYRLRGWA